MREGYRKMKENEIFELLGVIDDCMKQAYSTGYLHGTCEATHDTMDLNMHEYKELSYRSYKALSYNIIISAIKTYFASKNEYDDVTKKIIAKYVKEKLFPED